MRTRPSEQMYKDCFRYNEIVKFLSPIRNDSVLDKKLLLYTSKRIADKSKEIAEIDRQIDEIRKKRTVEHQVEKYKQQIKVIEVDNLKIGAKIDLSSEEKKEKIEHNLIVIMQIQKQIDEAEGKDFRNY